MKRNKSSTRGGGDDAKWDEGTNKKHSSSINSNDGHNKRKENKTNLPPSVIGTVAMRTRRQQKELASKWNQPISILINIMGYADPETIRMLCCVSKQFYDLIKNDPGMENNRAISLLQINPAEDQEDAGRLGRLLRLLYCHQDKFQLYREIKFIDADKFVCLFPNYEWMELKKITDTLGLYGIVSLDMSSPPPSTDMGQNVTHPHECTHHRYFELCCHIPSILPNLRDLNLSNNGFSSICLHNFLTQCPNLEKITWHNIDRDQSTINMNMKAATNLKEIYMDDSVFMVDAADERDKLLDLENDEHSNIFLFHHCSTKLERVSIRNAKWYVFAFGTRMYYASTVIPQNALIKFVRKAPTSLRWFRSDLTEENMMMLRSERPDIELVN